MSDLRNDDAQDEKVTGADAGPVDEEAMAAAEGLTVSDDVKQSYREATERGANQQGEGRIP